MAMSETVDFLLTPLDPERALRKIIVDVDRLATLDPKVNQARTLVSEAISGIPSAGYDNDILWVVFWLQLRGRLMEQPTVTAAFRGWLGDGDSVLQTVLQAVAHAFTPEILQTTIREAAALTSAGSPRAALFEQARQELQQVQAERPQDNPVVFGAIVVLVAGYIVGAEIGEIVHASHTLR